MPHDPINISTFIIPGRVASDDSFIGRYERSRWTMDPLAD
jgi:hypothetical protein